MNLASIAGRLGEHDALEKAAKDRLFDVLFFEVAPDGNGILFGSTRSGGYEIWTCRADGTQPLQVTHLDGPLVGTPRWSPDGQRIAFDLCAKGNADIFLSNTSGGALHRFVGGTGEEVLPSWSRDGQWLYFASNRSGQREIWKMPLAGGEPIQVTKAGGFEGFESPDGSLFYYTKARGVYGIYAVPAHGGEETLVPELSRAGYWRSWNVVNEGICFIAKEDAPQQTIRFFSFATRRITPLITVNGEALYWLSGLALSLDGKRLLFAQPEPRKDEIMLMENFR